MRMENMTGKRFGSLLVTDEYKVQHVKHGTLIKWKCKCDCGNVLWVFTSALKRRKVDYCPACRPSGIRHSRLYHIYHGIKQRCYNPKCPGYENYGGKGVRMSDEWLSDYNIFKEWSLANGYRPGIGLSIDRIDSDGNYEESNCQWIPLGENSAKSNYGRQQVFTKMKDVYAISSDGEKIPITNITKFARDHGLIPSSVHAALHGRISPVYHGWTFHSDQTRPLTKV